MDLAVGKAIDREAASKAKLEKAGLADIFREAHAGGIRAISITSVTDPDLKRRQSFTDKAEEVLVPLGSDEAELRKWSEELGVGWSCRKGLKPESPNQDSFSILVVEKDFALYCVYDGHGPLGHDISDVARESIVSYFLVHPKRDEDPKAALEECFLKCQKFLETSKGIDPTMSGTTCTMVYHQVRNEKLWVAHVGDSRAILGKQGVGMRDVEDLTIDHKPDLEEERRRIENSNPPGRVVFDGYYNHRVFALNGMYPGLNMSRALGDVIGHREAGLSALPDVKEIDLAAARGEHCGSLPLLLCTDGVWEFIASSEAMSLVSNHDSTQAHAAVQELAQVSWDRWMEDSNNEISDDITGILVHLTKPQQLH